MNKTAGSLLQWLLVIAGALVCLVALGFGMLYMSIRPKELPVGAAQHYIRLEAGDEVLHAFTGTRWLDSQRYFVVKADPAGFDARIAKLSAEARTTAGMTPAPEVSVTEGPGKDLWHRSESVPSWWDVEALQSAVAVDVRSPGDPFSGSLSIFSKDRGLIFVVDR